MRKNPTSDGIVAFGAIMTLLTVWSFIEAGKSKQSMQQQSNLIHQKLDNILAKLKK